MKTICCSIFTKDSLCQSNDNRIQTESALRAAAYCSITPSETFDSDRLKGAKNFFASRNESVDVFDNAGGSAVKMNFEIDLMDKTKMTKGVAIVPEKEERVFFNLV